MRIYFESLGCRLNEAELASWARAVRQRGGRVVARPQLADVMVLNTCAVTAEAARKSRKLTGRLHRTNPAAKLVLTGCLAALQPEQAAELAGVDLVLGNRDKEQLLDLVQAQLGLDLADADTSCDRPEAAAPRTRAFVKVQDGCHNRCTFCIVTVARGPERSKPIDALVDELNRLHADGSQEVVLTGVHLGGYGSDLGTNLQQLVEQLLLRTAIPRLRLSSLEPWEIAPDFWSLWHHSRLCPHVHLPLQSGSDTVLRRMARRCSVASYLDLVDRARAAIPDLVLTTDVIVGFPGETDAEFEQSLRTCEQVGFGHLHIFPYSPREGTAAAKMRPQVDAALKRERSARMQALSARMRRAEQQRAVGCERQVLWEGPGEQLAGNSRRWAGLTDNYLRVETTARPGVCLANQITTARIETLTADGRLLARAMGQVADAQDRASA